jgi:hypothetical protein
MKKLNVVRIHKRLAKDSQPADPVFARLFADLQLARWTRRHRPKDKATAKAFEKQAWSYVMNYLLTLERPDGKAFDLLSAK